MNTLQKRRLLHARRTKRKKGMPILLTAVLSLAALGSVCLAAGVGAMFIVYQSFAEACPHRGEAAADESGSQRSRPARSPGAPTNPDLQLLNRCRSTTSPRT
jgi:hypothetical protein